MPSNLFPLFDPNDVLDSDASRRIGYYQPVIQSGVAYATLQAEDGDRERDRRISDGLALAKKVDAGGGTKQERALRSKVIGFYVDQPPHYRTDLGSFQPRENDVYTGDIWQFNIPAADLDPFRVGLTPAGRPDDQVTLKRRVMFRYTASGGERDSVLWGDATTPQQFNVNIRDPRFVRPIPPGPVTLDLELCDCLDCDGFTTQGFAGQGRCVIKRINVTYAPPGSSAARPPNTSSTRPGTE